MGFFRTSILVNTLHKGGGDGGGDDDDTYIHKCTLIPVTFVKISKNDKGRWMLLL